MRILLVFLILLTLVGEYAAGQTLGPANVVRLTPSTMPATCNIGDLRTDSADSYKLKQCVSNVWIALAGDAETLQGRAVADVEPNDEDVLTWNDSASRWEPQAPSPGFLNPMTTAGDLIVGGALGSPGRLGIGATNTVLKSNGSAAAWGAILNANIDAAAAIDYSKLDLIGDIVNADINASAGIVDTKLATISTSGKVANSATTATASNSNNSIVLRNGSGAFSAGAITGTSFIGPLTGNADTATALNVDPTDCASNNYAISIDASGNLGCSLVSLTAGVTGTLPVANGGIGQTTLTGLNIPLLATDIITWDGQASAPSNPSAGFYKIWVDDTTGKPKIVNSSGTVSSLGGGGGSSGINMLAEYNNKAEEGTVYVAESGGGTLTTTTTTANVGNGLASFSYDASAATDYANSDLIAIPAGLYGANCLLETYYKGFDANVALQVHDGTNIIATQTLAAATNYTKAQINFVCPSSGSLQYRFYAGADAAIGYWDEVHLGSASNISNVSQATRLGKIKITGCAGDWARSSTTMGAFTATSGCSFTTEGLASQPATHIPAIRFAAGIPPGTIKVVARGLFWKSVSTTNSDVIFTFNDGTNTFSKQGISHASASGAIHGVSVLDGSQTYSTAQGDTTIQIYGAVSNTTSGTSAGITARTTGPSGSAVFDGLEIEVWHFPSTSQQAVNAATQFWRVDANISGANPSLGTSNVATYTSIDNGSLTLTNNTGNNVLTAQIPCSSTNTPSGTTCSSGSESLGVAFTIPRAGDVRACASFSHRINTYGASNVGEMRTTFQIVETPTNSATTLSQLGKSRVQSGVDSTNVTHYTEFHTFGHQVCGTFSFTSAGQKVLRLMYEQTVVTSAASSEILADADASRGQVDVHWEVYPIDQQFPAPALVGSVTSNSTGLVRIEHARLQCGSSSSITSQSGSWISSMTNGAAGVCTINITAGIFTAAPACVIQLENAAITAFSGTNITSVSTSAIGVQRFVNASNANGGIAITCMGPK